MRLSRSCKGEMPSEKLILAKGDPKKGAELFVAQCEHCHSFERGLHKFGPNLYSIFGRVSGQIPGSKASQSYKHKAIT